jgi:hypothetical protein
MGLVMMHISNQKTALETLLHAFHSQMNMGYKYIELTIKHLDGTTQWVRGDLDLVFRGDYVRDIEYHDLIVFQHFTKKDETSINWLGRDFTLNSLIDMHADKDSVIMGTVSREGPYAYFLFKNDPMTRYMLLGNEVISNMMPSGGLQGSILNNISGKLTCERGLSHMIRL